MITGSYDPKENTTIIYQKENQFTKIRCFQLNFLNVYSFSICL